MIDKETVQRIKDAANIVDVVGDYVQLVRRGANYMGLCPFHNERTPSFSVNPRRNFCYCFSCHKGGSPINFIIEKENISYHDALLQLAAKYGIEVHERELSDEERRRQDQRESMFTANRWAMEYFEHNLTGTQEGRDIGLQYFYQRGLTDEAIRAFHLGYAIDRGNDLVGAATKAGYETETLTELGLLGRSQQGDRLYDRFRGRVIFPVFTTSGKVVAFGGRTLKKDDKAKYINSPESVIYSKSNELYGIYQAKSAISKLDKCFLVEGYMDVIGMWQSGMQNVVASSGTALTDGQIAAIHRFTSNVTILYDGDSAGIHAALRGIDMFLSHGLNVKVLLLPDGHDPDSFARQNTPEQFQQYVEAHETDIIRFKADVLLRESGNDPARRAEAIRSIVTSLACIPDNIARTIYIGECAKILSVPEDVIAMETRRYREKAVADARRRRDRQAIDARGNTAQGNPPAAPDGPAYQRPDAGQQTPATPQQTPGQKPKRPDRVASVLHQCEEQVLTYCVRYGMVDFMEYLTDNDEKQKVYVAQFVDEETSVDSLTFSDPDFLRVFQEIMALRPSFEEARGEYLAILQEKYEEERSRRYDELRLQALSIEDLKSAERNIDSELESRLAADIYEHSATWLASELASHEDDTIRAIVTRMITRQHQLSKVYQQPGQHIPDESERLPELVPRAINEWKDAILMLRIRDLRSEMATAMTEGDTARATELQLQIEQMIHLRTLVAGKIGDRILSIR